MKLLNGGVTARNMKKKDGMHDSILRPSYGFSGFPASRLMLQHVLTARYKQKHIC